MKLPFLAPLAAAVMALSCPSLLAMEENQVAKVQLVLPIDRTEVQTSVALQIPFLAYGEMSLEEFGKRFRDPSDQALLEFFNAVRTGEGDLVAMTKTTHFQITDVAKFREMFGKQWFGPEITLRIKGIIPIDYGRAYLLEIRRNDEVQRRFFLTVVSREESPGPIVEFTLNDHPLLSVLDHSLNSPLAAQEIAPRGDQAVTPTAIGIDPWDYLRPAVIQPADHPALAKAIAGLSAKLKAGQIAEALTERGQRFMSVGLKKGDRKQLAQRIAPLLASLQKADRALNFDPVYVLLSPDKQVAPSILLNSEEEGWRIVDFSTQNAFTGLISELRFHTPKAPLPQDEVEPETAPH